MNTTLGRVALLLENLHMPMLDFDMVYAGRNNLTVNVNEKVSHALMNI
jgi:hypothetical protein